MTRDEERMRKPYRLIEIKDNGLMPIILPTNLYMLSEGRKYTDVLKCSKHYNTIKLNYNSKERYARLLFIKIVNAYIEFFIHDLLYSMRTVRMPFKKTKFFIKMSIKKNSTYNYLFDRNKYLGNIWINIFWYRDYIHCRYIANAIPSNKLKEMIMIGYNEGIRYNKKNAEYNG